MWRVKNKLQRWSYETYRYMCTTEDPNFNTGRHWGNMNLPPPPPPPPIFHEMRVHLSTTDFAHPSHHQLQLSGSTCSPVLHITNNTASHTHTHTHCTGSPVLHITNNTASHTHTHIVLAAQFYTSPITQPRTHTHTQAIWHTYATF